MNVSKLLSCIIDFVVVVFVVVVVVVVVVIVVIVITTITTVGSIKWLVNLVLTESILCVARSSKLR